MPFLDRSHTVSRDLARVVAHVDLASGAIMREFERRKLGRVSESSPPVCVSPFLYWVGSWPYGIVARLAIFRSTCLEDQRGVMFIPCALSAHHLAHVAVDNVLRIVLLEQLHVDVWLAPVRGAVDLPVAHPRFSSILS